MLDTEKKALAFAIESYTKKKRVNVMFLTKYGCNFWNAILTASLVLIRKDVSTKHWLNNIAIHSVVHFGQSDYMH